MIFKNIFYVGNGKEVSAKEVIDDILHYTGGNHMILRKSTPQDIIDDGIEPEADHKLFVTTEVELPPYE